jgi:hypothetical protein
MTGPPRFGSVRRSRDARTAAVLSRAPVAVGAGDHEYRKPALDHLPQVLKKMPAVYNLDSFRSAETGAAGIFG